MEKNTFYCSKHAIINAAADVLHEKKFYIVEINDKAGLIVAEQGLSLSSLGKTVILKIQEADSQMEVTVECTNRFKFGIPGVTKSIEKSVMNQLISDL
ncbi:MAG: hypothetical protein ACKO5Y_03710 [Bacteroidota bacterium]